MNDDLALLADGLAVLQDKLGLVEAERFVSLINRSKMNYTHWRKNLWPDKTVEDLFHQASKYFQEPS
ncbi:MAG: hypothetical protein A2284_08910 [Deltaproteobacteria bacterium RIFOXYA12_FULL_61_11]|nr:MAG: hypothetical protein A2284_08910 [Deltaproteobacteria bacterium RIFOXYA12_FULL_61_11]